MSIEAFLSMMGRESWQERWAKNVKEFQPWTEDMRWGETVAISAQSYKVLNLFPEVKPHKLCHHDKLPDDCKATSPKNSFLYRNTTLPARYPIMLMKKNGEREAKRGYVTFDGEIILPSLFEPGGWRGTPWMSLSPNELITLRPGTRKAKGHTIVAGLGLGHQLIQVSHRKQVKKLTLVEISAELVEWLMPRIKPHLGCPVDVVIGDANEVIPKMKADVCLMDIYEGFGFNQDWEFVHKCNGNIGTVWFWG